jgi:hypothetical protein
MKKLSMKFSGSDDKINIELEKIHGNKIFDNFIDK